jgi:hypothetical protein
MTAYDYFLCVGAAAGMLSLLGLIAYAVMINHAEKANEREFWRSGEKVFAGEAERVRGEHPYGRVPVKDIVADQAEARAKLRVRD